jgi:hypothetical protein
MREFLFYPFPRLVVNFVKIERQAIASLLTEGRKVRTAKSSASCDKQGIHSGMSGYRKCRRK